MKTQVVLLASVCCVAVAAVSWWFVRRSAVSPEEILAMEDLTRTKVAYSRSGYLTLEGSIAEVSAVIRGNGVASSPYGNRSPIRAQDFSGTVSSVVANNGRQSICRHGGERRWGVNLAALVD